MRLAIIRSTTTAGKATTFVLSFGVTFMLDPPVSRTVEWAKLAEPPLRTPDHQEELWMMRGGR